VLKGIPPLLTPDLLKVLAEMGHGDEIIIADANFTAASLAKEPSGATKPLIHLPGATIQQASEAVLTLFPLDAAVTQPVAYMKVCDTPKGYASGLQREMLSMLHSRGFASADQCEPIERFAFYDRVQRAFAIIVTGDLQPYGNFLFKKGVIGETLRP
jgi:L-fucose mutarotase